MQSVSSRIWTRVTMSISYDYNHYTTAPPKISLSSSFTNSLESLNRCRGNKAKTCNIQGKYIKRFSISSSHNTKTYWNTFINMVPSHNTNDSQPLIYQFCTSQTDKFAALNKICKLPPVFAFFFPLRWRYMKDRVYVPLRPTNLDAM